MEFYEKLQQLRKQKGLTQEQLAKSLYVSRTAISKWESGRGYPNIDSLKAIAKLFSVTVDELLSGEELLTAAEADCKQKESHLQDLLFGLLDLCVALLLFLPFFGENTNEGIRPISLLSVTELSPYLKWAYVDCVSSMILCGVLTLTLQNCNRCFWLKSKRMLSLLLNVYSVLLFIISRQPYPAILLFVFLIVKVIFAMKKQ